MLTLLPPRWGGVAIESAGQHMPLEPTARKQSMALGPVQTESPVSLNRTQARDLELAAISFPRPLRWRSLNPFAISVRAPQNRVLKQILLLECREDTDRPVRPIVTQKSSYARWLPQ